MGSVTEACALTSGAGSALETMLTPQGDHRLRGSVSKVERDENNVLEINGIEVAISAFETLPACDTLHSVLHITSLMVTCFYR